MTKSCCAVGCTNRKSKSSKLSFYRIPVGKSPFAKKRRELWLNAICRKNWPPAMQTNARLCSAHFISGKRSDNPSDPDFVPTVFSYLKTGEKSSSQKLSRFQRFKKRGLSNGKHQHLQDDAAECSGSSMDDPEDGNLQDITGCEAETPSSVAPAFTPANVVPPEVEQASITVTNQEYNMMHEDLCNLRLEVLQLRAELGDLSNTQVVNFNVLKNCPSNFKFVTGITVSIFLWLLEQCKKNLPTNGNLSAEDNLLIVLMKLRLGLLNQDLALRFKVEIKVITNCISIWLPVLAGVCSQLVMWPEKDALRTNLPKSFQKKFKRAVCIIDCTEIFIERPSSLTARAQTWSNYKSHNTIKYIVCCSPGGGICFLPPGWGGRTSDKNITLDCGLLKKIEYGDEVLADRGFNIVEELALQGAILHVPAYCRGKNQLSGCEIDTSRQLSRVRIHIERVIGRMKNFHILQQTIPISQVHHLDNIILAVAGLVNLNDRIV